MAEYLPSPALLAALTSAAQAIGLFVQPCAVGNADELAAAFASARPAWLNSALAAVQSPNRCKRLYD